MLLLIAFASYWIYTDYWQKRTELQQQMSGIFFDAIRQVEDQLLREQFKTLRLKVRTEKGELALEESDSIRIITMVSEEDATIDLSDFEGRSFLDSNELHGSLSQVVLIKSDSLSNLNLSQFDSLAHTISQAKELQRASTNFSWIAQDSSLWEAVTGQFADHLSRLELPFAFQLMQLDTTSKAELSSLATDTYVDLLSKHRYQIALYNYRAYLWQEITPMLAFAVLVVLLVGFAFIMVQRSLHQQQTLTNMRNDFIANITHELKTPITTVGVAIEALQHFDGLEDRQRTIEYLGMAQQELGRLASLVDKVLQTALLDQTTLQLKLENINLKNLIDSTLQSLHARFEQRAAKVAFTYTDDALLMLEGDRLHLSNVIHNLLDNALKYSPGKPEIQIKLSQQQHSIELQIQDQGIGIAKAHVDRIFERFFRAPTGNIHDVKGHGLGLSYVAAIVQAHQGNIQVQSEETGGSLFTLSFPSLSGT